MSEDRVDEARTWECEDCGALFYSLKALYGHRAGCPERDDPRSGLHDEQTT